MLHKMSYFPEPTHCKNKVELSLSKYATTSDLKSLRSLRSLSLGSFCLRSFVNLKTTADRLDVDKLKNVSSGLNDLKTKADKLDVDKLTPALIDF